MFFFPILLGLGIATGVAILSMRASAPSQQTKVSGPLGMPPHSPMLVLQAAVRAGESIPGTLIAAALEEARNTGNREAFREILRAFPPPNIIALQKQSTSPPQSAPQASSSPAPASPIRGVGAEEWGDFVASLKTQAPTFKTERHVGAFHHNLQRLSELGIDPATLTDEASQYKALEADITNVMDSCKKMINEWSGDVIQVNGTATPITCSGILGLIKAAGVEGAKQWLTSDESRLKYPNTTQQFFRTNGLF